MTNDTYTEFTKQLTTYIENNQATTPPPMIGVITNTSDDLKYCTVTTDQGTIPQIPAHGLPVNGDTAIIHFINGNYQQPVADCARRLPATNTTIEDYYTRECYNYHENGDLSQGTKGYTGNYEITDDDYKTETNPQSILLNTNQTYTQFTTTLPTTASNTIKFQAYYKGAGQLKIQATNPETEEPIPTLPHTNSTQYKTWTTNGSRWTWNTNKTVYENPAENQTTPSITIRITNTTPTTREYVDGVVYEGKTAMLVDGLLVYDENNDTNYYQNINDVI